MSIIRNSKCYKGWFYRPYEILTVVDFGNFSFRNETKSIYFIDFCKLKKEFCLDDNRCKRDTCVTKDGNIMEYILMPVEVLLSHNWILSINYYNQNDLYIAQKQFDDFVKNKKTIL